MQMIYGYLLRAIYNNRIGFFILRKNNFLL